MVRSDDIIDALYECQADRCFFLFLKKGLHTVIIKICLASTSTQVAPLECGMTPIPSDRESHGTALEGDQAL